MARVTISRPQSWVLEPGESLRRNWPEDVLADPEKLAHAEANRARYDDTTIFQSVDYSWRLGAFYAVGPSLLNLEQALWPFEMHLSLDGGESHQPLAHTRWARGLAPHNTVLMAQVGELAPAIAAAPDHVRLHIRAADGRSRDFRISDPAPQQHAGSAAPLTAMTLQKDNEVRWIIDWLRYHHALGIESFHIYDNGSANLDDLVTALRAMPDGPLITLVHWPFCYGLPLFGTSMFTQKGAISDHLLRTPDQGWILHCDIDEYIITGLDGRLDTLLRTQPQDVGAVQFACSDAFLVYGQDYPEKVTIRDLTWRRRELVEKYKNAYRTDLVQNAGVHGVKLIRRARAVILSEAEGFYLHARPLNTGWNSPNRRRGRKLHADGFVQDRRVQQVLATVPDGLKID